MRQLCLIVVFAGVTMLAACATAPEPTEAPASVSPATSAPTPVHGALAECLTEHGVPAAAGPVAGPPAGVDPDTWKKAMDACSTLGPGPASN